MLDLALATGELLRAYCIIASQSTDRLGEENSLASGEGPALTISQAQLVERVAWAVPRAASVVPWRSDCLRQAEAARHWLMRHRVTTRLFLGARKSAAGTFEAHAWLMCGDKVITGGDATSFSPFTAGPTA